MTHVAQPEPLCLLSVLTQFVGINDQIGDITRGEQFQDQIRIETRIQFPVKYLLDNIKHHVMPEVVPWELHKHRDDRSESSGNGKNPSCDSIGVCFGEMVTLSAVSATEGSAVLMIGVLPGMFKNPEVLFGAAPLSLSLPLSPFCKTSFKA
ncbi:hypothetical protein WICPIJ_009785 [Wickerhamomyces pijperi]|uniref:Uncharacterized protein n=1 Tax=Wickerhamomyces pijperi TaxID=599730 RepID=A0A9P8PJT7_WICPI|nr:hypothetical protein WICPIJ_009785 [Wickerhamomyces pijperi]